MPVADLVPFIIAEIINVPDFGEPRPPCIGYDDVEAPKPFHGLFHEPNIFFSDCCIL